MSSPRLLSKTTPLVSLFLALLLCSTATAAPSIKLSVKSGPPTSKTLVSGSDFGANTKVNVYFDSKDELQVITNNDGDFEEAEIHVPRTALPGEHVVKAVEQDNQQSAKQPFLVRTNWRQFHRLDMTRYNPYENVLDPGSVGRLKLKWKRGNYSYIFSSPALADGVLYFGTEASSGTNLYALNATSGRELWSIGLRGGTIYSSPAVVSALVFVGNEDYGLWAVHSPTGLIKWWYETNYGVESSPAVVDGVVYFGAGDGNVYALNAATGHVKWVDATGGFVTSSPAVLNGVVYVGSADGGVRAFTAKNGDELWTYRTGGQVYCSPSVAKGVVYVSSDDGYLYALNAKNGNKRWKFGPLGGNFEDSAPALTNDTVYIGGGSTMYALDPSTGLLRWSFGTSSGVQSSPAVANGVVYFGSHNGNVYALDAKTGAQLWTYTTDGQIDSSPTVANGMVYVGSFDGNLYAFGLPHGDETTKSPASERPALNALRSNLSLKALGR